MKVKNDTKLPNKSSRGSLRLILDQFDIIQFRTFRHLLHSIQNKLVEYLLVMDGILTGLWYIKANLIYIPLTITTWCWGSSSLQFGVTTLLLLLNWLEPATQIELDEINKVIKLGSGVQTTRYQNKYIVTSTKGQLILKCPFGSVFKSSKKPTKFFPGFLP